MNTISISLSSDDTQYVLKTSLVPLNDNTLVSLDLKNIYSRIIPIYMIIDWGDGNKENFDNDFSLPDREDTNLFQAGTLLNTVHNHIYYPSPTSLYRSLTAQIYVEYCNGEYNWFILPLKIRTHDYFESIYDMELIHTNILPVSDNSKEHQILTTEGNYCIELRSS